MKCSVLVGLPSVALYAFLMLSVRSARQIHSSSLI
jgi:hypothetical protein